MIVISVLKDLSGQQFGKLKVMSRANNDKKGRAMWLCKCECNNEVIVAGYNLRNKNNPTQSCGCLNREVLLKSHKKYNNYDLSGEYGIGYTTNTNAEFYFDLEDYDRIKNYCWRENNNGYIVTGDGVLLHRVILNVENDLDVDHIKHHIYDNRKSQIRIVDTTHNMMNKSLMNSNKSSKITGVSWDAQHKKWNTYIDLYGQRKMLGMYNNLNVAINKRKEAEEKYFGEFSYDNSVNQ